MATMTEAYRDATKSQMPDVPTDVIDTLGIDYDAEIGTPVPYIAQTGGWIMTIACATRMLTQDDDRFLVCEYATDEDGEMIYLGDDWGSAWQMLNG